MIFSSLLFLFRFLPVMLLLYFAVPRGWRNAVLFLGSLVFYAWGEPVYVLLMLFSTAVDYTHGRIIQNARAEGKERKARLALLSSVVINLGLLGVFKYTDFVIQSINTVTGLAIPLANLPLPIGISFYTFQTMSYSIDVYRGEAKAQKKMIDFGAYVAMFPQLIAGPIVRYQTVAEELNTRRETPEKFADGIALFMVGLGKKVLLANNIGMLWDTVAAMPAAELSAATAWIGAAAFGFQIYFDFSGYSDMARGLGLMLGFHFPLNFDYPYISRSITEFWRRWHISLGTWFREYVYISLGGNRRGRAIQLRNIFIVWMLTGIWHGASWNFLLWGVFFGVLLAVEKFFLLNRLENSPKIVGRLYTIVLVLISWVIFASVDGAGGPRYLAAMFGFGAGALDTAALYLLRNYGVLFLLCAVGATPLPARAAGWLREKLSGTANRSEERAEGESSCALQSGRAGTARDSVAWQLLWSAAAAVMFLVCVAYLVDATYNPFLYFRF